LRRPGLLIPVFFLSSVTAAGQYQSADAIVAATGESFATRSGYSAVMLNQAGLARVHHPSLSLHHHQPFITGEIGISSVVFQMPVERGALGINYSGCGIRGLRYNAAWFSYGLDLHPDLSAGAGMYVHFSGIHGRTFHRWGVSCALGIQLRIGGGLMLGAHVMHPAGWISSGMEGRMKEMMITTGFSYTFFHTATMYGELHIRSEEFIQTCWGLETEITETILLCLGMHNAPFCLGFGVQTLQRSWSVQIAWQYILDTGNTPHASLAHIF
jgi:hypothetical protein